MDPNSLNRWVLFSVAAPIFVDKSSLRLNFVSKLFVHFSFASFWVALVLFCINIVSTNSFENSFLRVHECTTKYAVGYREVYF